MQKLSQKNLDSYRLAFGLLRALASEPFRASEIFGSSVSQISYSSGSFRAKANAGPMN